MATGGDEETYRPQDQGERSEGNTGEDDVATESVSSFRLYIGNLKPNTTEETLRTLFDEHGIVIGSVLVKRTFAFVDCPDKATADTAIDKFNGLQFSGSDKMQVEPSVGRRRRSNKIQIRNFPNHIGVEEIQELVNSYGPVQKCELVGAEGLVYVTFDSADTAQQAVNRLNGIDFQGSAITVDFASSKTRKKVGNIGGPPNVHHPPMQQSGGNAKAPELPLRMIVGSEFVGAIIGRAGQTIHNITTQSRARVDIHRAEHSMTLDTVITIKGSPESCTTACMEILKIVQSEAQALVKGKGPQEQLGSEKDCPLRLLCPNQLCGRIIGKGGSVIKNFMEQSGTHIIVSNASEGNMYVDRVVTITGPLDNCKKAEQLISEKMRKCNELDYQNFQQMGMFPPNMGPGGPMGPGFYQGGRGGPPFPPGPFPMGPGMYPGPGLYNPPQPPPQQLEVYYMYIPEPTVGAVIGSKGANIKNIMRLSNARVKILDQNSQGGERKEPRGGQNRPDDHRKVIITGTPEAQWKAQFYIVEKVRTEIGMPEAEGVQLRSEVLVPKSVIGRIIGKGGQNVKEMQRVTGATVRTPDTKAFQEGEDVPVTIIGDFYASQSAQRRIRALMSQALQGVRDGPPPPPSGRRMMNGN